MVFIVALSKTQIYSSPAHITNRQGVSNCMFLQILKLLLQILKVKGGETYSPASRIHAVTVFPLYCLNAALKVL